MIELKMILSHNQNQNINVILSHFVFAVLLIHRTGILIQPLAKAMAKITKGVDIPNMII